MRIEELKIGDWVLVNGERRQVYSLDGITGLVGLRGLGNKVGMGIIQPDSHPNDTSDNSKR